MESLEKSLKVLEDTHKLWKASMIDYTKEIRKIIHDFAKNGLIIPNGQLMYNMFINNDDANDFYNMDLLTFFIYRKNVPKVFSKHYYNSPRVDFTDLSLDSYSRDVIYYVPHSGFVDPMRLPIARMHVIPDDYELRIMKIGTINTISLDYLFIEWYSLISNPREILALSRWEEIDGYRKKIMEKMNVHRTSVIPTGDEKRNKKLENFFHGNKSIIIIGDFAINTLLALNKESHQFSHYKILLMNNITKTKDTIIGILRDCRYTQENNIIMKYHGPKITFHEKHGNKRIVLEVFITNEQCVPYFSMNGYQFARIATILKYIHLEEPTDLRNETIIRLLDAQKVYLEKEKLTEFDSSPFQMYDVNCLGEYISPLRKKRIKIYRNQLGGMLPG